MTNLLKNILLYFLLSLSTSCLHGEGFNQPATLRLEVPPGPPEFQAGWRAGCRSALATKAFANSWVYTNDYGNGTLQHDRAYARGWGYGWFACVLHTANFVNAPLFKYGPLE